ncbi:MAG TPA: hypothetical protein VGC95_06265 [Chitinophagaceae bacterium]
MKKVLVVYGVLIVAIIAWYYGVGREKHIVDDSKGKALAVSKHSLGFNMALQKVMTDYYTLTAGFENGDTAKIDRAAASLAVSLGSLPVNELKKDSSIYQTASIFWDNAKTEIAGLAADPSLQAKREALNLFSNEVFTLMLTIRYDLAKLYWQECGSAFGDDTPGNWLSETEKPGNPYGQPGCQVVKKVINFAPSDTLRTGH